MSFMRCARPFLVVALAVFFSWQSRASDLAVSQYGRVTATLPWAVAMEKGYFAAEGVKVDHIISGRRRRHHAAQHAGERPALWRGRDLGGARRHPLRPRHRHRQHGERPHRRDRAGRQPEEQRPQGPGPGRQEGRLHQSEVDQRDCCCGWRSRKPAWSARSSRSAPAGSAAGSRCSIPAASMRRR